jgi:hypothetical protein
VNTLEADTRLSAWLLERRGSQFVWNFVSPINTSPLFPHLIAVRVSL